MCKTILMMFLAVVSSSAMAEWVRIYETDNFNTYVDPDTIRKSGHKVKMWNIFDYKTPQDEADGKKYSSTTHLEQYDCKEIQLRVLATADYSGTLGKGDPILFSNNIDEWMPIPPNTVAESLFKYACGKK